MPKVDVWPGARRWPRRRGAADADPVRGDVRSGRVGLFFSPPRRIVELALTIPRSLVARAEQVIESRRK